MSDFPHQQTLFIPGNNVVHRLDRISHERYRVLCWGEETHGIHCMHF